MSVEESLLTEDSLRAVKELGVPFPKIPPMFPKSTNALAGHRDIITIPTIAQDDQADYEGELAVVIGRDAKNISANDALDYVIGYSVANDVSARYSRGVSGIRDIC
jgi:2-keto-4-pentenoate hydratase/2-oxohepta-3-ene-1,7-dioic acid hydratase in catechol pathway